MEELNTNEDVGLKNSDQYFIQNNYKRMSLEDICQSTGLEPEIITSYIEDYEKYMNENDINVDDNFTFNINITPAGNVSYGIRWPSNLQTIDSLIPYVGKGMFLLNNGDFKASIIKFLLNYAEERGTFSVVRQIMEVWNEKEDEQKVQPIIKPHEVFKGA